ncbi:MAG: type ISP restriction/modification enzyme [Candidatus Brocadiia bacterium]
MTNPLEAYLKELRDIRGTGAAVAETSFYPALSSLLNEIGKTLKPRVRCVVNPANRGAGLPDVGLFTADQIRKNDPNPMQGQLPARGVVEVKGPAEDVKRIARSEQVKRYSAKYGVVLVTNYRDFLLLGRDAQGNPLPMEAYTLAGDEAAFWQAAGHPQKTADEHGARFCEYLARVMQSNAPLSAPQDLAWFLASYARDAKARVETHKDLPTLAAVRGALEEALGMKFTGDKGEHFFRSTLVQTIFYGVFSAWVLWHRERPERTDDFNWHESAFSLRVPFIRALYEQVATPRKLGDLGLVEVLDWTTGALNRVDRAAFFQKFQREHAVQYFYEPFLEAFDPELRKELGVWFTPPEIVKYQVARVDTVLREELGLADGLADPNVVVLDPCCGTAAYVLEVLQRIAETLKAKGGDALVASDLKKAAMTRVFGFEILPAPFIVSHLQLGLMLHDWGAPLSATGNERVGVYLTNSLTGWEPPREPKQTVLAFMEELQQEKDAAEKVKREARVLVILGNPPYNAFAGVSPEEEQGLVEPYKEGLNKPTAAGGWEIKKFNLDDLYVRFFRLAERRIAEMTGKGVVSFISNLSYLSDPSYVVMRQRFLGEFDKLWFDCMNGDSRETGKLTPDGESDPSVFSTDYNREGIRVGTAISVVVRKEKRDREPVVRFRHFWGVTKRQALLDSLAAKRIDAVYTTATPCKENRFSFRPEKVECYYMSWAAVNEISELRPSLGILENRRNALIDIDKVCLERRMEQYLNPEVEWESLTASGLTCDAARFNAKNARAKILSRESFDVSRLRRVLVAPMDYRWCYYTAVRPIWNEPRPALEEQVRAKNTCFMSRRKWVGDPSALPFCHTTTIGLQHSLHKDAYYFPLLLMPSAKAKKTGGQGSFLGAPSSAAPKANLSAAARAYLAGLGVKDPDAGADAAGTIWLHALAVGYSPAYLSENADGIRRDWPRIPLPDTRKALEASAALGRQVAALLDTEADVSAVTAGNLEPIFRTVGVLTKVGGGNLDPDAGDLAVTAGWGHAGKEGVTMPAKGRIVQRPYDKAELEALRNAAEARGLSLSKAIALLGAETCDVYLNDVAYWKNIPANVWEYYIGGYQVIKKWLSYREQELLGRALRAEEAREVTGMARRLARIVLLQPILDANYTIAKAHAYAWPGTDQTDKGGTADRT